MTTHPPIWIMSLNRLFFFGRYPLDINQNKTIHVFWLLKIKKNIFLIPPCLRRHLKPVDPFQICFQIIELLGRLRQVTVENVDAVDGDKHRAPMLSLLVNMTFVSMLATWTGQFPCHHMWSVKDGRNWQCHDIFLPPPHTLTTDHVPVPAQAQPAAVTHGQPQAHQDMSSSPSQITVAYVQMLGHKHEEVAGFPNLTQ